MSAVIRPARAGEAATLSDLAFRSKAHWGYSPKFMDACRRALTVHGTCVEPTYVAEIDGEIAGFYQLDGTEVSHFFVEPRFLRRGVGRSLWTHLVETAKDTGLDEVTILSDPNAEAFYLAMGAQRAGEEPSDVFGAERMLPRLRYRL